MPQRSIVPGRKFSTITSAPAHNSAAICCPRGSRKLRATERLLRESTDHQSEWSLWRSCPHSRIGSPAGGASTFTTSAPKSASSVPTYGPARSCPNSSARRPVSGPEASSSVAIRHRDERILGAQDVHPHDRLGSLGRAFGKCRDELAMARLRERAMPLVAPERAAEAARDARRGAQRRREARAARSLDHDRVELLVPGDLVVDGAGLAASPRIRAGHERMQPVELTPVDAQRRTRSGRRLEQHPHLVEVDQIGARERAHERAAARLDVDEPLALQLHERLAHGRARASEALGERRGAQALTRPELTRENRLPQLLGHPKGARRAGDDRRGSGQGVHTKSRSHRESNPRTAHFAFKPPTATWGHATWGQTPPGGV